MMQVRFNLFLRPAYNFAFRCSLLGQRCPWLCPQCFLLFTMDLKSEVLRGPEKKVEPYLHHLFLRMMQRQTGAFRMKVFSQRLFTTLRNRGDGRTIMPFLKFKKRFRLTGQEGKMSGKVTPVRVNRHPDPQPIFDVTTEFIRP